MRAEGKFHLAALTGLAMMAALLLAYLAIRPGPIKPTPIQTSAATLLPELRPLAPFSLRDQQGRTYDNSRLQGHWTLLSFGYTHCPDICPTTLATLAQLKQLLKQKGMQAPLEIGFVSVDPERDTPQRLREYVGYFDPALLGISGPPAAIETLTRPLGIHYRKVITEESAMNYVVDHSASLVLLDPQGRYYALFSPPHEAAIMARDILMISQTAGD
ncbi:MAG: SCO family protein [Candidatus Thiodiazotropha sp.]